MIKRGRPGKGASFSVSECNNRDTRGKRYAAVLPLPVDPTIRVDRPAGIWNLRVNKWESGRGF